MHFFNTNLLASCIFLFHSMLDALHVLEALVISIDRTNGQVVVLFSLLLCYWPLLMFVVHCPSIFLLCLAVHLILNGWVVLLHKKNPSVESIELNLDMWMQSFFSCIR